MRFFIYIALGLLLFSSCKKEEEEAPVTSLEVRVLDQDGIRITAAVEVFLFTDLTSFNNSVTNELASGFIQSATTSGGAVTFSDLDATTTYYVYIYYFKDFDGEIIYVGKSINIKKRVQSHMRNFSTKKGITIIETIQSIEFKLTGNETMALLYETMEIKIHRPIHNRAQKKTKYPFGISVNRDEEFHKLELTEVNQTSDTVIEFGSRREAKSFILTIIERFELCQKLNGLENVNRVGSCFQYQLHNCNGGCIGEESAEDYNLRIEKFESQYGYTNESGIYTSTGRKKSEISFVLLDNGIITGFGFTNSSMGLNKGSLQLLTEEFNPDKDFQRAFKTMKRNGKFEKAAEF